MARTKSLQTQIRELLQPFADGLAKILVDRVIAARGAPSPSKGNKQAGAAPKRAASRSTNGTASPDMASAKLLAEIARSPGLRSEELQRATGLAPEVVRSALTRLRRERTVRTKGTRRAMTYTRAPQRS